MSDPSKKGSGWSKKAKTKPPLVRVSRNNYLSLYADAVLNPSAVAGIFPPATTEGFSSAKLRPGLGRAKTRLTKQLFKADDWTGPAFYD